MTRSLFVFLLCSGVLISFCCQSYGQPGKARPQRNAENKKNEPPALPSMQLDLSAAGLGYQRMRGEIGGNRPAGTSAVADVVAKSTLRACQRPSRDLNGTSNEPHSTTS